MAATLPPTVGDVGRAEPARWDLRLAWAAILLGTAVRLRLYIANRALWTDEAMLALNLIRRPLGRLVGEPLDFQQAAPPLFLAVQKGVVAALGPSEYALRIVPLVSGLAVMVIAFLLAARLTTRWPAAVAAALAALSKGLIEYAALAKQYESDVLVTLVVIAAGLPLLQAPGAWRPWAVVRLGIVAVVAGWASHPAVFTVIGTIGVLLAQQAAGRRWANVGYAVAVAVPAAASQLAEYALTLRPLEASAYLHAFWADGFMPLPVRPGHALGWLLKVIPEPLASPGGYKVWGVPTVGLILGAAFLWRAGRWTLALLFGPVLLAVVAAAVQRYPFVNRLSLFALPLLFLVTSIGLCSPSRWVQATWGRVSAGVLVAAALVAVVLVPAVIRSARWVVAPEPIEEIKPVLAYVGGHLRPADRIYVFRGARPAFLYYRARFGLGGADVVFGQEIDADSLRADVAEQLAGRPRAWVIVTHDNPDGHGSRSKPLVAALAATGRRIDQVQGAGGTAVAYLFDLTAGSAAAGPRVGPSTRR